MRISAMTCILLCSVPVGVIQVQEEATPASPFFPDVTTLPGVELQPLLEKWDAALEIEDYPERHYALPTVSRIVPQDMRFRGATVLRYDNPEIIDRVVNLFLEECVKHDEMTTEKQSKRNNPWHWAEGAEYLYDLGSTAQSTFDPRIYKTVLNPPGCYLGGLRELYLATVNPEQTLAYLLESKRGGLTGTGHPDYFRHGSMAWGMSVDGAYTLLSLMTVQSPNVLRKHRGQVLEFVMTYIDHFRELREVSYKPELVYKRFDDYDVRNGALDVLELLGTADEVQLVEQIIRDVPPMEPEKLDGGPRNRREQISEKGARVIELIRQRTEPVE